MTPQAKMIKGYLEHPSLGKVLITVRPQARQFIARWKPDGLHLTAPPGASVEQMKSVLEQMAPKLEQKRPEVPDWSHGREYDFGDIKVIFKHIGPPDRVSVQSQHNHVYHLVLPQQPDLSADSLRRSVARIIDRVGKYEGTRILLPLAEQIANELGCRPRGWKVGNGRRKLGHCTAQGEIMLSGVLCFYPVELRRYIILHELAHLSEMNHSARFHAICNHYCHGREAQLERALKAYKPPF